MPSKSATAVAPRAAFIEVQNASRTPGLFTARSNHSSVKPSIGHACERDLLKA